MEETTWSVWEKHNIKQAIFYEEVVQFEDEGGCDPGHAQVHARDKCRLNESSTIMVEAYKKKSKEENTLDQ